MNNYYLPPTDLDNPIRFHLLEQPTNKKYIYRILPNPANTSLRIISELPVRTLTINSTSGKQVYYESFDNKKDILLNVTHLPDGVYLVKAEFGIGSISVESVVILH